MEPAGAGREGPGRKPSKERTLCFQNEEATHEGVGRDPASGVWEEKGTPFRLRSGSESS